MVFANLVTAFAVSALMIGSAAHAADDRLGVPGPVDFGDAEYGLVTVLAPEAGYTKQEYLPDGETLEDYRSMMLVEFLAGDMSATAPAGAQVRMLDERRATDPFVNYDVFMADDEDGVVLDFLLSGVSASGRQIVEWNAYRYLQGQAGVWLTGISRRAYDDDITSFLERLDRQRRVDVERLVALSVVPGVIE